MPVEAWKPAVMAGLKHEDVFAQMFGPYASFYIHLQGADTRNMYEEICLVLRRIM